MKKRLAVAALIVTLASGVWGQSEDRRPIYSYKVGGVMNLGDGPLGRALITPGLRLDWNLSESIGASVELVAATDWRLTNILLFAGGSVYYQTPRFFAGVGAEYLAWLAGAAVDGPASEFLPKAETGIRIGRMAVSGYVMTRVDEFLRSNIAGVSVAFEF